MKFLIIFIGMILFGADNESSMGWVDYTFIIIGFLFVLSYFSSIVESFQKGKGVVLISFFIGLVLWRGYINYSVGGSFIPFSFSELNEWAFNELGFIEAILWIILLYSPFHFASQNACPACNSTDLKELQIEKIPQGVTTKDVDGVKRDFNIYHYDTTYKCLKCGNEFKLTETKEELI